MRHLALLLCALALTGLPAHAETFMGRTVKITDGRADRTQPAPLVVALHGFLGAPRNMQRKTGFDRLAARKGFVVVYPNGVSRRWNDGRLDGNTVDDVGFLTALIRALIAEGRVDPGSVFLAGHSNGGGMAMRMACERPAMIRGISVVATKVAHNFRCPGGTPIPAILFHGTKDPISPHTGRSGSSMLGGALSGAASLEDWKARNRCNGRGREQRIDRVDDDTSARIVQFSGCAAPLVYVLIDGHGHGWPRPTGRSTLLQGPASREIDASALSWWFFASL